jgi:ATP-binding cassette, subfamily C, bacterial CydCD
VKPVDRRLLRHARQTWVHVAVLVGLGAVTAGLLIAQAQLLAGAIATGFAGRASLTVLRGTVLALAVVVTGRAGVAWATEAASYRASAAVKSELRRRLLTRAVQLGPRWLAGGRTAELTELATEGINALDGYFSRYLPQLVLAVIVPVAVLVRIGLADPLSAAVIALTLPLVPLFGALVGRTAGDRARERWEALAGLAHHFADVVAGLPTLKVFGRARSQRESIAAVTGQYRRATLRTLSLAFLSSLVLELIAMMSVALVATEIGLRLVYGHLDLRTGLLALILAPEAYLPLRQAGAGFHASADGLAAAGDAFAVIETPAPAPGARPAPPPRAIRLEGIAVSHDGRPRPAPDGVSLGVARGQITAITGPSGCGKSTLLDVVLGFARPSAGRVTVEGPDGATDLADIDPDAWRGRVAWVAQDPVLFPGTVESNIRLGWDHAPPAALEAARRAAGLDEVALGRPVGENGAGLSAGQRRRVALARALVTSPDRRPVLLLDEPTAGLDEVTEARVIAALRSQSRAGRLVLVASHRPALLAAADQVCRIGGAGDAGRTGPDAGRNHAGQAMLS